MTGNGKFIPPKKNVIWGWFMKLFYHHYNTIYHVTTMDIPLYILLDLMPISSYNSNGYTIITLLYHYHTYLLL